MAPNLFTQETSKIKIKIKGAQDTVLFLAHYYGDKTYLDDTAYISKKGEYIFESDSLLPEGMYIVAGQQNNRYFEFIMDANQVFSISTDKKDIPGNLKFKGSEINGLFYEYIQVNTKNHIEMKRLSDRKKELSGQTDSINVLDKKIAGLNSELENYKQDFIHEHPKSFITAMFKAMMEPKMDSVPVLENGKEDSVYAYNYYKQHYWDNFDVTDARLLRTPLFHNKLEKYFTRVIYQTPDTIIKEADIFINKTRPDKETFKYTVWYLTFKFETSNIMGFDEIFVHMTDTYYATGEAFWADSSVVKSITKHANALRPVLIGNRAPNLILLDTSNSFESLYSIKADYTIIFFYEYGCGHCKKEITALKAWEQNSDLDFKIFAVCTDTSLVAWKKFIRKKEMNWINVNGTRSVTPDYHDLYNIQMTPSIFLLDEKKKIIAKRLKTEQLKPFLDNYEKRRQPKG
jgi:peroxiredoxin